MRIIDVLKDVLKANFSGDDSDDENDRSKYYFGPLTLWGCFIRIAVFLITAWVLIPLARSCSGK